MVDEEGVIEEMIVVAAAVVVDTAMIVTATIDAEMEATVTGGVIVVVPWTIEATVEVIAIMMKVEEVTGTTTIADAVAEMISVDVTGHHLEEDLPGEAVITDAAVVLAADHHLEVEIIGETTEEVEVIQEVLREDVMTIVIGAATTITEVAAAMMTTSAVVLQRCTAETIVEEMIAGIVVRNFLFEFLQGSCCENQTITCLGF